MICDNCKAQIENDMSYCPKCGEPVDKKKKLKYPPLINYIMSIFLSLLIVIIYFMNYSQFKEGDPDLSYIIYFVFEFLILSLTGLILSILIRIKTKKASEDEFNKLISSSKKITINRQQYVLIENIAIKIVDLITKVSAFALISILIYTAVESEGGFNKFINNLMGGSVVGNWYFECQSVGNASCVATYNYLTFNEDNTLTCTEVYNQGTGSCGTGTWSQDNSTVTIYWNKSPITPAYTATATLNGDTLISGNQVLSRTK